MTFERTKDVGLVGELVKQAWDRPAMLCDGADPENIHLPDSAQCFVGFTNGKPVALFVGYQQSPVCIDVHACLTPDCRGANAIEMIQGFWAWLKENTPYRKVMGTIPSYNRPMLLVARAAGMSVLAVSRQSTLRNGKLEDQAIMERFL